MPARVQTLHPAAHRHPAETGAGSRRPQLREASLRWLRGDRLAIQLLLQTPWLHMKKPARTHRCCQAIGHSYTPATHPPGALPAAWRCSLHRGCSCCSRGPCQGGTCCPQSNASGPAAEQSRSRQLAAEAGAAMRRRRVMRGSERRGWGLVSLEEEWGENCLLKDHRGS